VDQSCRGGAAPGLGSVDVVAIANVNNNNPLIATNYLLLLFLSFLSTISGRR
jgi:hypothetical protein